MGKLVPNISNLFGVLSGYNYNRIIDNKGFTIEIADKNNLLQIKKRIFKKKHNIIYKS